MGPPCTGTRALQVGAMEVAYVVQLPVLVLLRTQDSYRNHAGVK